MKTIIYNQKFDIFNIFLIKYKSRVWFQFEATQGKGSYEFSVDLVRNSTFSSRFFNYSCISSMLSSLPIYNETRIGIFVRNRNWDFWEKHELELFSLPIVLIYMSHAIFGSISYVSFNFIYFVRFCI